MVAVLSSSDAWCGVPFGCFRLRISVAVQQMRRQLNHAMMQSASKVSRCTGLEATYTAAARNFMLIPVTASDRSRHQTGSPIGANDVMAGDSADGG